jgi:hypothetical protein
MIKSPIRVVHTKPSRFETRTYAHALPEFNYTYSVTDDDNYFIATLCSGKIASIYSDKSTSILVGRKK